MDVRPVGTVDVHPADVASFLAAEINRLQGLADDRVRFRRQLFGCTQRQQNPGRRGSTSPVLLPPSVYVGEHTPALFLNFLVNLGNLLRVAGKEPLELGKLPRYALGIASPVDALPHERQGLIAADGAALEETLVISRRPP